MMYNLEEIVKYVMLLRKEVNYYDTESGAILTGIVKEVVIDSTYAIHLTLVFKNADGSINTEKPPVWVYDLSNLKIKKTFYDTLIDNAMKKY